MIDRSQRDASPPKVLVVAIGNPDRGDDGVGALVAARLRGRLAPGVTLVARSGNILSLMEEWVDFHAVICIDAAAPIEEPGRIHRIDVGAGELRGDTSIVSSFVSSFVSSHAFGLAQAIALAGELRLLPKILTLYAIEGASFDAGAAINPEIAAASDKVAHYVIADIGRIQRGEVDSFLHE